MSFKVDIFIPTSKDTHVLKKCLKSLNVQSVKNFTIILIGLNKDPAIEKLISRFNNLKINYFIQQKKGLVEAANEALIKSNGDIFIRVDDDVTVTKNWLKNILITFNKESKIGGVTGPTLVNEKVLNSRDSLNFILRFKNSNNPFSKLLNYVYETYLYENKMFEVGKFLRSGNFSIGANFSTCLKIKSQEVENFEACNFACKTSLIKRLGGFDETFAKGLGDYHEADMACKIRKSGYKIIFNPQAIVHHHIEAGGKIKSRPDSYNRIKNFIIFYRRHMKISSFDTLLRFSINVILQNGYYLYKFLTTGNISNLGSIPGTITGLLGI
ncbi:MAG: glycosyltransferase [Candidatus Roizmanbacteria bacterium]|nr:MAG: glycosyltransferase [Candidatus Roizmanbacteria bacterium]